MQVARMSEQPLKDIDSNSSSTKPNWQSSRIIFSIIKYFILYLDRITSRWTHESRRTVKQSDETERSLQRWNKIPDKEKPRTGQNIWRRSEKRKNKGLAKLISSENVSPETLIR